MAGNVARARIFFEAWQAKNRVDRYAALARNRRSAAATI
jgi:hypothetical protein